MSFSGFKSFFSTMLFSTMVIVFAHRRDAEDAENFFFLLSVERAESKKIQSTCGHSFKLFTTRTSPSRMTAVLKFKISPKFSFASLRYVKSWAL